jgi:hypothetical protein
MGCEEDVVCAVAVAVLCRVALTNGTCLIRIDTSRGFCAAHELSLDAERRRLSTVRACEECDMAWICGGKIVFQPALQ